MPSLPAPPVLPNKSDRCVCGGGKGCVRGLHNMIPGQLYIHTISTIGGFAFVYLGTTLVTFLGIDAIDS